MLRKLRERINEEKGFTLIELLVVILIIGILAAIALPAFLGQQKKGQDAEAKSNARNAVSQVESCYANEHDYAQLRDGGRSSATPASPIDAARTRKVTTSPPPRERQSSPSCRRRRSGNIVHDQAHRRRPRSGSCSGARQAPTPAAAGPATPGSPRASVGTHVRLSLLA